MIEALTALALLAVPAQLVWAAWRFPLAARVGPIVLCYAAGLAVGLAGLLPEAGEPVRARLSEASLGLALPLLLFSVDIRAWGRIAGRALLSMLLAVLSVVLLAVLLHHLFLARGVAAPEQLSAMAVAMYTGGIANLGAVKLALAIPDSRYLLFATVDTVVGAVYLLFVLTAAPRLFRQVLPGFPAAARTDAVELAEDTPPSRRDILPGAVALVAAAACVGLALALGPWLSVLEPQIATIVLLTSFGLAGSLLGPLRRNAAAPRLGMFLIYVFSFAVAASMDLGTLAGMNPAILIFVVAATFGSLILHAVLCRLFRIDADTFLITSVAAIMSPAFVPMAARALRNPAVLMSGMATGILGFAIGNYLGISIALFLTSGG